MTQRASKALSLSEEQQLLGYLATQSDRNRAAATLALTTGLRISELCHLTIGHVIEGKDIRLTLLVNAEIAKGRAPRALPLPRSTREMLNNYVHVLVSHRKSYKPTDLLFTGTTWRKPMTARSFQRAIMNAGLTAIGRPVTPHMLRHTYLSRMLKSSDLATVQELAGHKSIKTTQIYLHPSADDLAAAVSRAYDQETP